MNKKVLKITQGALMTAIFGVLVFLNRQTAGLAVEFMIYIFPLPIAIYCARYGFRDGAPALAAMALLSFLLGSLNYAFYAATGLLTGYVFGGCIHRGCSAGKTLLFMMIISVIVNLVDLLVMTELTGISLESEIVEMQGMMSSLKEQMSGMLSASAGTAGTEQLDAVFDLYSSVSFVKRMLIIGMMLLGILQAFLIYVLGTMIMKRMKIRVPKFSLRGESMLPHWCGYALGALYIGSQVAFQVFASNYSGEIQTFTDLGTEGIVLYAIYAFTRVFLIIEGIRPMARFIRRMTNSRGLSVLLTVILVLVFAALPAVIGFLYMTGLLKKFTDRLERNEKDGDGRNAGNVNSGSGQAGSPGQAGGTLTGAARPLLEDPGKTDYLMLVNPWHALPEGYDEKIGPELEVYRSPYTGKESYLEKRTMQALRDMMAAMEEDGVTVDLCDGFRTVKNQEAVMERMIAAYGEEYARTFVAVPGYSEHHTGLAADLYLVIDGRVINKREEYTAATEEWAKVHEYLTTYGFILRYPEGRRDITGIIYEPWHIRFVGEGAAMRMQMAGQTLEEYLGQA